MSDSFAQLVEILGPSPWREERSLAKVEEGWAVRLPPEVHRVACSYGDALIDDFLFIYGPRTLKKKGVWMSDYVEGGGSRHIIKPVLPRPGGMLLWGHTIEGDRLFLVPKESAENWTVAAFRRNWGDWHETEIGVEEWLLGVLRGEIETDWLPEWPKRHEFELSDSD
ncbi:hypothetical protein ACFV1H_15185 [Streptomyces virginiae]|uniref:hypothetical protein n=1 Tax=Streptomyces virginiae TaxID=1961 RepID=UPI0036C359E7